MNDNKSEMSAIQKALLRAKELREAGMLNNRTPVEKLLDNPRIGRAVRMFCFECNGYSRSAATNCENSDCALWLFRRGGHTPNTDELEQWRENYANHMKQAGELDKNSDDDFVDDEENDTEE